MRRWLLSLLALVGCAGARPTAPVSAGGVDAEGFRALMERGPRAGGRGIEFFGGAKVTDLPMHMTWHHLVFDERSGRRSAWASTPSG